MPGIETSDGALPFRAVLYHVSLEVAVLNEIISAWLEIIKAPFKWPEQTSHPSTVHIILHKVSFSTCF